MNTEELKNALKPGQMAQVGCVVRDLSKTIESYENMLGIGPFSVVDFIPEKGFIKGRKADIHLKIGIAQFTPELSIELIQIIKGEPYHKDFLNEHGEGVQHLGFFTNEYDAVLNRAEALGIEVLMWAETDVEGMGHVRGAYLDTYDMVGTLIEIIEVKP